ncbi:lysophospholipid acyltransferase family protein [Micromonospora endophytica]|uniref:1-acyl-sn-glycerol-3-phosphate acyltransferase n=1 Tax=Micromonospora endophytica TaxID=515350 RepID=A0A2W2C5B0_9ACTN|nr:lysophospholipid acyltransferase family protein [Micromonospora endophytica]PZF87954.1 1-acyl-sn-glycerol-3-phosphate acyltransferase [Micromonospora endophytica]RIW41113.1 1-acyl-sn-glycerol-3-phosphate acyltransferase [Micromonospora endophytica]BCJ60632.1 1-acyl-sn-glycerol-3-phosphate acyltransferase [Micromonospora endophytica]
MPEIVYPPVIAAARTMFRVLDLKLTVEGSAHVPATGGAVLASNHVSYLDFIFCGLGALESKRLVRFMAKDSVFRHRVSGPLMRGMRHIPVDRRAGAESYAAAVTALRAGEAVGVFPEATISRSFTVKELKSGATRMAREAGVPVLPVALWGTQRLWTKGRPRTLTRRHTPITVLVGEPMSPAGYPDASAMSVELSRRLTALVDRAQREYPDRPADPADRWWLPAHLGGTAPTPEQAAALDAEERQARTA